MSVRRLRDGAAGLALAVAATALSALPAFDIFHAGDADILHFLREVVAPVHADPADSPVAVVAITPESYDAAGLAGIPRIMWTDQIATVQQRVLDGGATVFGWDLVQYNLAGEALGDVMAGRVDLPDDVRRQVRRLDTALLKGVKKYGRQEGRIVLGIADLGTGLLEPHPGLKRAVGEASNVRYVNVLTDLDGVVRGVPLGWTEGGAFHPAFAMEIALRHSGASVEFTGGPDIRFGEVAMPVIATGGDDANLLVNFDTGPGAVPTYGFHDLLACGDPDYFAEHFGGRAVLFGVVEGFEDRKLMTNYLVTHPDFTNAPEACAGPSPHPAEFARLSHPGIYLHAQAVRNLLDGNPVARPGTGLRIGVAFAMALLCAGLALWKKPVTAIALSTVMATAYALIATLVFRDGTELPLTDPLGAGFLAFAGTVGYRFVAADKERAQIRKTFTQYLDRKVIEAMIDSGDVPELGGENRRITCFFSDIEAFSTISEAMDPPALVAFLNEYFEIIGVQIETHGGIIERFLGDAVCAVFGAPVRDSDHAVNAVRCALAIDRGLAAAQDRFDVPEGRFVRTRIGINTGDMTAGNVGATRRKTYTVMGDAVNLAARLESVNKQYGTLLMAGDETVTATGDLFEWRLLDRVRVVGRTTPVGLYEPLGEKGMVPQERLRLRDDYEAALSRFQAGAFEDARAVFQALAAVGDAASAKAVERCNERMENPPPPGWDGVTDLTKK